MIDIHSVTGKRLNWYRRYLNKFDDDIDVINSLSDAAPFEAIKLSQYIEALLNGRSGVPCPEILQGLELRESLSVIHFIAHYRSRLLGSSFQPLSITNGELAQHYQYVWAMLENWSDAYYKFLNQYLEHPMSNKGVGGLHKHFRDLYESLHRQGGTRELLG